MQYVIFFNDKVEIQDNLIFIKITVIDINLIIIKRKIFIRWGMCTLFLIFQIEQTCEPVKQVNYFITFSS